ncbi:MAG: ABC transporter ATP-binding protein/permease [Bosea sp.]|nr:ABC transporter ATP-binding protein/permease [Bosea sp. (in: a-proteobacteria)]
MTDSTLPTSAASPTLSGSEQGSAAPAAKPRAGLAADLEAAASFLRLSHGWWRGRGAAQAWFWTLSLAAMVVVNVGVNVGVNAWHGWFFNALERKDAAVAGMAMVAFPGIVLVAAGVGVLILKTRETLQVYWRQWLSDRLVELWVSRRRFQRLAPSGLEPSNPEYRIADDVRWATEPLVDFAIGLLSAVITVITFVGILWSIGGALTIGQGEGAVRIPAYLVLAAILYGVLISTLMLLVGRRLPRRYAQRNESEARFRFGLMRLRDSADAIAMGGGQFAERRAIADTYGTLALRWLAVIRERVKLTWITNGNGVLVPVVPLLLAAPKYLSGELSLGSVMQIAAAFVQVQIAFNWIVENFMRIAEWLASARRVNELVEAIDRLEDQPPAAAQRPRRLAGAEGVVAAHDLVLKDRDGRPLGPPLSFEVRAGSTLHLGDLGQEVASAVLRAVADQWHWGSGAVSVAPEARIGSVVRRMRWAETRLADVLAADDAVPEPALLRAALIRAGLDRLIDRLDEVADWDKTLAEAERQRLGIARLLVATPQIVLFDDALDALGENEAASMLSNLRAALPAAILITAGASALRCPTAACALDMAAAGAAQAASEAAPIHPPHRPRKQPQILHKARRQ